MHENDGRQYDKNGLEYFACHCGDLLNTRETGSGRGATMTHLGTGFSSMSKNESQR